MENLWFLKIILWHVQNVWILNFVCTKNGSNNCKKFGHLSEKIQK